MAGNMTRIISKFKSSYCLVDGSFPLNLVTRRKYCRRGYCATQAEEGSTKRDHQQKLVKDERANSVSSESSWVPDPVTGYYKPSTQTEEVIINKNNNKNTNKP
ncbi:late embryogenesis abundant protein Lea5 isoform X1 [Solanum tuberosum]|uniref:late embryogenesis abundant protein Lea5 isoform X1 n=1 Tax=Solanum tuberosum TaxID=4113 RepID=UPI000739FD32|nr:PREDICTED: late embryogenesis abundant protein Lea5 isoform X1 [Solanum tuberosum]